jgi:nitrous oxide reductase accessory protein NosL
MRERLPAVSIAGQDMMGERGQEVGRMKKFYIATASVLFIVFSVLPGYANEDIQKHPVCGYCNMDRGKFGHARMLIEYSDETVAATCSLHCSVIDLIQNRTKIPCRIMVGDYGTKKLIDTAAAFWVVGGAKPGVMTERAKWAFEKRTDAEEFVKKNGGKHATFQVALRAAYEGLYEDMKTTLDRVKLSKSHGSKLCKQYQTVTSLSCSR